MDGGITNLNHLVTHANEKFVVRPGDETPVHQIMRFNELAAGSAVFAAGSSLTARSHADGLPVIANIPGQTLTPAKIQQD